MVFQSMSDEEKDLYLDVLRDGTTPFDRFVSRGRMEDVIDIPGPRVPVDRFLFRAINQTQNDQSTRMIPVLGSAGSGKTHAYWAYKNLIHKMQSGSTEEIADLPDMLPQGWSIVYVPSPPAAVRILLHVYTCLLDELKVDVLRTVAKKLIERWGGHKKKKLGLFGGQDLEETIQNGIREYPGVFADCVKAFCIFELDNTRGGLAERWLLGEELTEDELDSLGINGVIESDDVCLAMIKLICENAGSTIILYFDELESPYRMHGPEAEQKFLETLKRLYNEIKNLVIVLAVLKEIWPRVLETADQAMRSRMEQERELNYFKFDDLLLYFAKAMEYFWAQNNLNPPVYPLFPLNEAVLKVIYDKTDGNQRSIIKLIRLFVDKIILEDMTLEEVVQSGKEEESKIHVKPEIAAAVSQKADATGPDKSIIEQVEDMMNADDYTIEANPASVAGAALKSIKVLAEKFSKPITMNLDFKFKIGKRQYSLAGMVEHEGVKYGIEVPSVKSFNRSGGVAAFYAIKRLTQAIGIGSINKGVLIVPEGTQGAKYVSMCQQFEETVKVQEFNEDSAKFMIQQAITEPSKEAQLMTEYIVGELPAYQAPVPIAPVEEETVEETEESGESSEDSQE